MIGRLPTEGHGGVDEGEARRRLRRFAELLDARSVDFAEASQDLARLLLHARQRNGRSPARERPQLRVPPEPQARPPQWSGLWHSAERWEEVALALTERVDQREEISVPIPESRRDEGSP